MGDNFTELAMSWEALNKAVNAMLVAQPGKKSAAANDVEVARAHHEDVFSGFTRSMLEIATKRNNEYNPPLKEAGFMDLTLRLIEVASQPHAVEVLQQRPQKQRDAAIRLQLAAEQYVAAVEDSI